MPSILHSLDLLNFPNTYVNQKLDKKECCLHVQCSYVTIFGTPPPPPPPLRAKLSMQCRSLQLLGCQSARSKHLKGQKNKRFPWVWKSFDFFALQMLRLALHCITQLVLHTFEEEEGGVGGMGSKNRYVGQSL